MCWPTRPARCLCRDLRYLKFFLAEGVVHLSINMCTCEMMCFGFNCRQTRKPGDLGKKGVPCTMNPWYIFPIQFIDYNAYPLTKYPALSDEKADQENESTKATPQAFPIENNNDSSVYKRRSRCWKNKASASNHNTLFSQEQRGNYSSSWWWSFKENIRMTVSIK